MIAQLTNKYILIIYAFLKLDFGTVFKNSDTVPVLCNVHTLGQVIKLKQEAKTKTMKENIKENKKTNTKAQNDLSLLFKYRKFLMGFAALWILMTHEW